MSKLTGGEIAEIISCNYIHIEFEDLEDRQRLKFFRDDGTNDIMDFIKVHMGK